MAMTSQFSASARARDIDLTLRELQADTLPFVLAGLCVLGILLVVGAPEFQDPLQGGVPGVLLLLLPTVIWRLRKSNYLASVWAVVVVCLMEDLLVATWADASAAICLLAVPVGLAALFVSMAGGVLTAVVCTCVLLLAPSHLLPLDKFLRLTALVATWSTMGLIWLTSRPLLTAIQWSWSGYEQNRNLLEQARDYQVQLKQALQDLADSNLQLTRLNRLAQGMREAAEEARKAKEQFVANISHELRTPLNMIIGFSEMIVQAPTTYGGNIPAALLADLEVILRNARHLSKLIDDVLDLSQIDAGEIALTREFVALSELVESATVAVRPLFVSKSLDLQIELPHTLPLIYCDRTRVHEVLLNLLSNAVRFTERGGVFVRAWQEGGDIVVSVADTGPGIAAEDMGKLFQPFQQLDGSIRRRYGGSGLGLYISKKFIELHGGKMWVESERGVGTTFFFRLPVEPPMPPEGPPARWLYSQWEYKERTRPSAIRTAPVRPHYVILETGTALQRLLSRYGGDPEIVPVQTIEQAAHELARVPTQALLVNEVAVTDALQRVSNSAVLPYGVPAIICSIPGYHDAATGLGVAEYLIKPVSRDTLIATLDRLKLPGNTILIVDDEPEALRLFRRMLLSSGRAYRVLRASDGRQALQMLRMQRPDAILLDLVMPEMDGFQFLQERDRDPALRRIPVIVISARDPAGHPIISNAVAATRGGGLSVTQVLRCIEALSRILSTTGQPADPAPPAG